ncbi:MAG TPA: DNA/RNA helicase domain-containing protein, partial [Acetobacteraceae bacterium]|nr:DNA/RNA helicase domain-containing protein [Acetobacteraceae bacterium]
MTAWWSGSSARFCKDEPESIIGILARRLVETHMVNHETQIRAWREQIVLLRRALTAHPDWHVLFEYPLLRLGRRIDAVVLTNRVIFVIEFKVGTSAFLMADERQVEDYALDLHDFHAGSHSHPIVPVLVATEGYPAAFMLPLIWHGVTPVMHASGTTLGILLGEINERIPAPQVLLNAEAWEAAPYRPVPTIVEAATMLYRKHGVADIAAARADTANLTRTTSIVHEAIAAARAGNHHTVLFITGIPGAGKTLCGLNAVFQTEQDAAFLTGNLPLVHVLREALARDAAENGNTSLRMARHRVESAVQPLLGFLRDNVQRTDPPHEHVIVFDEAQRAWDAEFGRRKFGLDDSEAGLFLDIMRRHQDWAVIIALVGSGQEINTGEAGLASWGAALAARPEWCVMAPPDVIDADDPARCLYRAKPPRMKIEPDLHLDVAVRQIRSAAAAGWVDAV